jgi:molybdopterin molybdotransferase
MTQDKELLNVSEALQRLLDHFFPLEIIHIPVGAALGLVVGEDIVAPYDFPVFPNSSMDGFAVRAEDVLSASHDHPASLRVVGDIPAGWTPQRPLQAGEAMRIMTGAPIPDGADAVVPVEATNFNQHRSGVHAPQTVLIFRPVESGGYIRPVGQDVRQGEVVIPKGRRIRPQDAGFLSMLGRATVPVHRRPRVAVFSSGDELLPVDQPLTPGKIHDANSIMLVGLVEQYGGEVFNLGIVPDSLEAVQMTFARAVDLGVDLIISSAGVSVGAMDFVRAVIEREGRLIFWRVNMRPGKPLLFGTYGDVPFVGLPGNPVSAFIGFEVFLRPVLMKMLGQVTTARPRWRARLLEPLKSDGRETYVRAIVEWQDGEFVGRLAGHQGSGNLFALVQSNALLFVPSGVKYVPTGAQVDVWLLSELLGTD